jgi:hypothetical protein
VIGGREFDRQVGRRFRSITLGICVLVALALGVEPDSMIAGVIGWLLMDVFGLVLAYRADRLGGGA